MVEYPIVVYDPPIWTVYMHVNKINGKKYVGITSQKPQKRWSKDGRGYAPAHGNNNLFYNAICKYGWKNFEHVILLSNVTSYVATVMEIYLINEIGTLDPQGYNSKSGGQRGTYGCKYSDNYCKKKSGYNSTSSLEVICLNNGERFGSAADAQRKTNAKCVAYACRTGKYSGTDINGNPLRWMYFKDYESLSEQEINEILSKKPYTHHMKSIICLNTEQTFPSALQAVKFTDKNNSYGIIETCKGERNYYGNHCLSGEPMHWMYKEDYDKLSEIEKEDLRARFYTGSFLMPKEE